ncbi:MAG: hypothetical protein SGJ19_05370 [Planctomycetia bacterium]|nr:hypothetical protein [Planctomycetia bacterium]
MPRMAGEERVEERPLAVKRRGDLVARSVARRQGMTVVVKDPISLRYFELGLEEAWLWERLDGERSLGQLCREFELQFAPRRIEPAQLEALVRRLRADNLVLAPGVEQAEVLWEEAQRRARRQCISALLQPWAIRFRGIDPARLLESLYPWMRWAFTPTALAVGAALVICAALLAITRFDQLTAKLPPLEAFLRLENAIWIVLALSLVKVLHELGHGLVGRHFGVRCHELGVMLLAGVPCLYCNVTDAWTLSDKWQRAAIGAAGIAVELLLASLALFLWWFSAPGPLNSLCLSVLLVCSIGTLVFNGNPLLRYDGYYVLSDLVATPNLRDEAFARVEEQLLAVFAGVAPREHFALGLPRWLSGYAIASLAYSVAVLGGLAWFCYQWLRPWGAGPLVAMAAVACAAGMVTPSAMRMARAARLESLSGEPVWRRLAWRGGASFALLAALAFIPLPSRVQAPGVIMPRASRQLYVLVEGSLAEALPAGTTVREGETVARLVNHRLLEEAARLLGEQRYRALHVAHLEQFSVRDDDASLRLPAAREALVDTDERLRNCRLELARLEIKAPIDGVLLPAARVDPAVGPHELPTWSGSPLEPSNIGATLLPETVIGSVGDPSHVDVLLACDEADVTRVAVGQTATVVSDQSRGTAVAARVTEITPLDMETAPPELTARGLLPTRRDGPISEAAPLETLYQVRLELAARPPGTLVGGAARASIQVAPESLFTRTQRFLAQTFGNGS